MQDIVLCFNIKNPEIKTNISYSGFYDLKYFYNYLNLLVNSPLKLVSYAFLNSDLLKF